MDARIVQFMGLVNALLNQRPPASQLAEDNQARQAVRTFAVEALGPRFGLVEWVDGTGPLYNVYKQHAQHAAVAQTMLGERFGSHGGKAGGWATAACGCVKLGEVGSYLLSMAGCSGKLRCPGAHALCQQC